jgi:hypothetical protein
MILTKETTFKSFMPPGIVNIGGKTYVCPGWHEIPAGTTLKEVYNHWVQVKPKMEAKPTHTISEMVDSSTAGKQYVVTFDGRFWNCECAGYQFRKACRHINDIKTKHNIK